jgi:hypothetical protein
MFSFCSVFLFYVMVVMLVLLYCCFIVLFLLLLCVRAGPLINLVAVELTTRISKILNRTICRQREVPWGEAVSRQAEFLRYV